MPVGFNFSLIVITATLFSRSLSQKACGTGWFGTGCKYQCQCSSKQCQSSGECMRGKSCHTGWFGPSCQYRNRAAFTKGNQSWIRDEKIGTCNPGTSIIIVPFDHSYHFTWLRIVYNSTALSSEVPGSVYFFFKDILHNTVNCTSKTVFTVDPSTVDIHCKINTSIIQIILRGNDALRICELFMDGGRNVALKQQTTQSSVLVSAGFQYSSSLAVDGSQDANFQKKSCSRTNVGDTNPTWFLHLPRPAIIDRVLVVNRDVTPELLRGFTLQKLYANGTLVQNYKEPGLIKAFYPIDFWSLTPVDKIRINASSVLTLCEVVVFGDFICPRLKWGLDCMNDCRCNPSELCSPITGKCDTACQPGLYGPLCELDCPMNCFNAQCFKVTGTCIKCKKGYMGDICDIECLPNKYGSDCLLTCHSNCRTRNCNNSAIETGDGNNCSDRVCDHDGWCYECNDPTRYGVNCTLECSKSCQNKSCDIRAGTCYACKSGFYGENCSQVCSENCKDGCKLPYGVCNGCKSTFYGNKCALLCPITCRERTCHATNGTCLQRCPNDFYGPTCSYQCPKMCKNENCHVINGSCIEGCEKGAFGVNCLDICPKRCSNHICDFFNGTCFACDKAYYGVLCDLRCSEDCSGNTCDIHNGVCSSVAYIDYHLEVVAPIVVVVVFSLLAIALLQKRTRHSEAEECQKDQNESAED